MANAVELLKSVETLKDNLPELQIGDTVKVHVRIVEGKNERIQVFQGVVIAQGGSGINETVTVRPDGRISLQRIENSSSTPRVWTNLK